MRAWREEAAEITAAERQSLHLLWCGSTLASDKSYIICALQASGQGWALSPLTRSISLRLNQRLPWSNLTGSPQVPDKLLTTRHHPAPQTHIPLPQTHTQTHIHTVPQAWDRWLKLYKKVSTVHWGAILCMYVWIYIWNANTINTTVLFIIFL